MQDLIDPDLAARLDGLDLRSRKVFAGKLQGERRSKRRGKSVDFDDYREYVPGDDLRHLDWNVFARLDRFFIKVFQEEEDLALHLIVDASASMNAGVPNKLLFAARLAMALGYVGLVNNNRVGVSVLGGPTARGAALVRLEPLRGRRNVPRLSQFLIDALFGDVRAESGALVDAERPDRGPQREFTDACRLIASTPMGKGVTLVLSDLLIPPTPARRGEPAEPGYQAGLRLLAGALGTDHHVLQVLSPGELDPAQERSADREGQAPSAADAAEPAQVLGDLRLTDVETGRTAEVTVTLALLERYRAAAKRYVEAARAFCVARGLGHALVTTDTPIGPLMLEELRRRGVLV